MKKTASRDAKQIGRRAQQALDTRNIILASARKLFAERGFANTTIEDLLMRMGIARGALYHHFRDKEDLFRAVFEETLREARQKIVAASSTEAGVWENLRRGREAFLDSWTNPAVYRILLIDGPGVLSAESRRQIMGAMGPAFTENALLHDSLRALEEVGEIELESFEPLATILGGAFDAAALAIATAEDPRKARVEIGAALNLLIDGLRLLADRGGRRKVNASKSHGHRRKRNRNVTK